MAPSAMSVFPTFVSDQCGHLQMQPDMVSYELPNDFASSSSY